MFGPVDSDDEWRRKIRISLVVLLLIAGAIAYGFVNPGSPSGGTDVDPCEAGSSAPVCQ